VNIGIGINLDINFHVRTGLPGNVFLSGFPMNEHIRCILVYLFILGVSDDIFTLIRAYGVEREGDYCMTDPENENRNCRSLTSVTVPAGVACRTKENSRHNLK
jgi:hypothetical protein